MNYSVSLAFPDQVIFLSRLKKCIQFIIIVMQCYKIFSSQPYLNIAGVYGNFNNIEPTYMKSGKIYVLYQFYVCWVISFRYAPLQNE